MADIYQKKELIPENLPEVLTPVNNNQRIIVEKTLYGAGAIRDKINTDFSELNKPKPQNLDKFFNDYEELFYDIPEEGDEKSHRAILETSGEYLNMFESRDNEIERLESQIDELQERIDELENPEEHPFYPNGSVLSADKGGSYYYMERGRKRNIVGGRPGQVWKTLKVALGFKESDDDYEMNIVKATPRNVLGQIKNGPKLDLEDLGGGLPQSPKSIAVKIDPSDYKANPDRYDSVEEYTVALENEIRQAWDLERNMETLYNKYANDRVNEYTAEDRRRAEELFQETKPLLEEARKKLAAYKVIYQQIKSNQSIDIEGLSQMYDTLTKEDFEYIPDSALDQFKGWEKGKGDLESVVKYFNARGERGTEFY